MALGTNGNNHFISGSCHFSFLEKIHLNQEKLAKMIWPIYNLFLTSLFKKTIKYNTLSFQEFFLRDEM